MNVDPVMLRIYLLGRFHLDYNGRALDIPRREGVLRLFTRLLLEPDHPLPRKTLAFSLWPDVSEADALANLRRHLHLLGRALPEPIRSLLVVSANSITWKSDPACWLDVNEFERPVSELPALESAVMLYRGDLAAGMDIDDFILARREGLRSRYRNLLWTLTQRWAECGQLERALSWVRKLIALEPWDEEAIRHKMTLEYQSGNRPAALSTYQTLVHDLETEFATLPLPETMALYTDILNNRLSRSMQRNQASRPDFISRQNELSQLGAALLELKDGHGQVIFITGEAGAGKTSLLREALRSVAEGSLLFWGASPAPSEDGARPYFPWRQILASAAPIIAREKQISSELLAWLLPLIPDLQVLRPGLFSPSQPDPHELHAALRQTFQALALKQPLILALEDLHWADDPSLDLLRDLGNLCASLPLLLLVTHRTDKVMPHLLEVKRELRRLRCLHEIDLRPFRVQEIRLFLERALGSEHVQERLVSELTSYSRGLPLLLREAAESLNEVRQVQNDFPMSLQAALHLRLSQLDARPRQMLQAAAVLGFSFLDPELAAALNWDPAHYGLALDRLLARRLLVDALHTSREDYAFSHQLIHEMILNEIPAEDAVRLHRAAACALEDVHADGQGYAARIAQHYDEAHLPVAGARHWLRHARELAEVAAFDHAMQVLDRIQRLDANSLDIRQILAEAALQRVLIAHHRGNLEQALTYLEAALAACREFPPLYCEVLITQTHILYTCDRSAEGLQSARQAIALARANRDELAEIRALHYQALCHLMSGNTAIAVDDLEMVFARLEASNLTHSTLYVQNLNYLGTALVFVQNYPRAQVMLDKTAALARSAGAKRMESSALTMLGQVALNRGRYGEAIRLYSQAIELAGTSYLPGLWGKYAGRGAAYLRSGDVMLARADFERGLEVSLQVGSTYGRLLMQGYLIETAFSHLDLADGLPSLADLERSAENFAPVLLQICTHSGESWRMLGEADKAAEAFLRGQHAAEASGVPLFMLMSRIYLRMDLDTAIAQARATDEQPLLVRALLAQAEADPRQGLPLAEEALTLAHACPDQRLIAQAFLALARLHHEQGHFSAALQALSQARTLAEAHFWPLLIQIEFVEEKWGKAPVEARADEYCQALLRLLGK